MPEERETSGPERVKGAGEDASPSPDVADENTAAGGQEEIGGRDGPDPTRYGDWEKNGRCIDF